MIATDVSEDALAIARENADRLEARVAFAHGSMLAGVARPVEVIVSNPPYITRADYETLQPEVRKYEPASALLAGEEQGWTECAWWPERQPARSSMGACW